MVAAAGESLTVEFKRATRGSINHREITEAVVCLANGEGGRLLLGVENDGTITGAEDPSGGRVDQVSMRAMILNRTEPPTPALVEVVEVEPDVDVVVIDVDKAPGPVGTKEGLYKRRSVQHDGTPRCVAYLPHEIISSGLSASGRDYAETSVRDATLSDLDPREFDRFRALCRTDKGDSSLASASDDDILRALRLVRPGTQEVTLGAILLLGTADALARYVPTAEVLLQELRGTSLVTNEQIRAPLFKTAERVRELLAVRNSEQEILVGIQRIGIPRLPDGIVREVVANALVHRDYSELGPIRVQLSDDDLRVTSTGGLPAGITLANLLDESRPRSVILADAFKRAGIVDRNGRGVREIYLGLLRSGRSGPDYSATNDKLVTVVIPTSDADIEIVRFVIGHDQQAGRPLTIGQLQILHELKAVHDTTASEISDVLHVPEVKSREVLARLGEMGLVEPRGTGRGRRYFLTAAFYRSADANAYVRLQDTEPLQQEQMIINYVEKFGSITRGKAAELCRLSPQQARAVLKRLTEEGELKLTGERRGARYIRRHR